MSPIGDGGWRIHYLGPWTWHTHGQRDGWGFPQRHWGWRLIITARGQRLDLRGQALDGLLDAFEAGLRFPNILPGACNCQRNELGMATENSGRCPTHPLPGCPNPACGETWIEAFHGDHCDSCGWSKMADQCDRCLPGIDGERIPIWSPGELPCEHTRSDLPDDCACGNELRPGLHIKGPGARCDPDFYTRSDQ